MDPPWEARTDFEVFRTLAYSVSQMAVKHLGPAPTSSPHR
ncbi:respiratory nitrate reductase alpha chain [Cutibacterium acnes JCM 18918]|nr:respiratory nitrate reductase alpha chain [Cutibacterium acnes JCM 18918]